MLQVFAMYQNCLPLLLQVSLYVLVQVMLQVALCWALKSLIYYIRVHHDVVLL